MARKKTRAASHRGFWLGVLLALLLGAGLLFLSHRSIPPTPTPQPPQPTQQAHTIALGSYGATVRIGGQLRALEIQPLAELRGPAGTPAPILSQSSVEAIVTNTLLSYPQLERLATSPATRTAFRKLLGERLARLVPPSPEAWKLRVIRLHTRITAIPSA